MSAQNGHSSYKIILDGETVAQVGDDLSPASQQGYTGHVGDNTGLVYMQARYYDPVIGRFYSNDPLDVLRLACLILFGILDLTERPFRMYTLKIHDALRYFSWILFIREPPLTKHQEFFLIFESSERPCLLSNAQYVSDQARLSLPPEVKIRRVQDHLFTVECEKFNVIIACTTDDSDLTLRVRCHEECILKSRDLDTKMHIDDQIIDVAPGETLIMIGQVDLL